MAGSFPALEAAAAARIAEPTDLTVFLNPATGHARTSGTLASLAALERALDTAVPVAVDRALAGSSCCTRWSTGSAVPAAVHWR